MIPLVILAGGRATRLAAHSVERPKFLIPLGDGRVFADLQLEWVRAQGFRDVTLSVGYLASMIRDEIGDGSRYGLRIRYVEDGHTPLGTGGAVRQAMQPLGTAAAILYGDTMLDLPCPQVVQAASGTHALMTVIECPKEHVANADFDGAHVTYEKKNPHLAWRFIDYGFSVVSHEFLSQIPAARPSDLAETFAAASRRGELKGFLATVPFREINTPDALEAFKRWARAKA